MLVVFFCLYGINFSSNKKYFYNTTSTKGVHVMAILFEEGDTIFTLFEKRVKESCSKGAYRQYYARKGEWMGYTWRQMELKVSKYRDSFISDGFRRGDKVAIMVSNSVEWVAFDLAAHSLGLVTVPLYATDNPANVAYIIDDANVQFLFVEDDEQWREIALESAVLLMGLKRVIVRFGEPFDGSQESTRWSLNEWIQVGAHDLHSQLRASLADLKDAEAVGGTEGKISSDDLASIVYTSGTTGCPKGVMLSHRNMLTNASMLCKHKTRMHDNMFSEKDTFLSFLPLSHMFERIVGYLVPMMVGAHVTYSRSVTLLGEDLMWIKPTVLVSVPRIYEKVYGKIMDGLQEKSPIARALFRLAIKVGWKRFEHAQGRQSWGPSLLLWPLLNKLVAGKVMARLGGNIKIAACGGAAISSEIAKTFIGLGLPLLQGYGLTESSVVISCNLIEGNKPESVGKLLPGVEVFLGEHDELLTKSDCVMMGYYNNPEATKEAIAGGWLRTGDKARIDDDWNIHITGRIKEIIVMSNGENVPPADVEMAITLDTTFAQAMIIGEARPYLTAMVVVEPEKLSALKKQFNGTLEAELKKRLDNQLSSFPGHVFVKNLTITEKPWTVENGLLTPTMKMKRRKIMELHNDVIEGMYASRV